MGALIVQTAIASLGSAAIIYIIWLVFSKINTALEKRESDRISKLPPEDQVQAWTDLKNKKQGQNNRLKWLIGVPLFLMFVLPAILAVVLK